MIGSQQSVNSPVLPQLFSKVPFWKAFGIETDRNSVSVSVTAPKLAIILVSVMVVIVKHSFGLLSPMTETTTRFRPEPKLSLLAIR